MFDRRVFSSSRLPFAAGVIGTLVTILACPSPALAQHRARLSKDLADDIRYNGGSLVQVIVDLPQAEVDRVAAANHLQVVRRLDSGAALVGTARQVGAMANDPMVAAISEDNIVKGAAIEVTTAATGANQLWAGKSLKGFGGITGSNVTVAVIDSGISTLQPDLKNRVLAWRDFVDPNATMMVDEYGHGTHVAGIIAGSGAGSMGGDDPALIGMAPGANLISLRVLGKKEKRKE